MNNRRQCLKCIEPYGVRRGPEFHITGVGVDEPMPRGIVNRPAGTWSWLLMHFHDPVIIEAADGKLWRPADSIMAWPESAGHYYGNPDGEWSHSWMHFVGDCAGSIMAGAGLPLNKPFAFKGRHELNALLTQMHHEMKSRREPDETMLLHFLHIIVKTAGRAYLEGDESAAIPERLQAAQRHMERNLSGKVTLAELARISHLSVPHFCAEFKKHIGNSPIDHLIELKMAQARYLLGDMNMQVSEVAAQVGYDDQFQFSKMFKRRFGLNPSDARKSCGKADARQ